MAIKDKVIKVIEGLGKQNLPVYTVATVALFKGILRPTFTMMDKKEDLATKKYAAVREGATELIAMPTYIAMSLLAQKIIAPLFSTTGKNPSKFHHSAVSTVSFVGVCFAALYAIPKLCNVAMPHVMKALKMEKPLPEGQKAPQVAAVASVDNKTANVGQVKSVYPAKPMSASGGMKI